MKDLKNKIKNMKGITLIALIITIIVLLILAGVVINMTLGNDGIISKAQGAVDMYKNAQEKEDDALNTALGYIDVFERGGNGTTETTQIRGGEKATNGNKKHVTPQQKAIIPEGWTLSGFESEQSIEKGLVIYDLKGDTITNWNEDTNSNGIPDVQENYNQFVWVPVSNFNEFKREHFGSVGQKWWTNFSETQPDENILYEPSANGTANTTEVEKMYKSVKDNGGFYIGRYEASDDNGTAVCVKNAIPYGIAWSSSNEANVETGGAVEKARAMYPNSTLCYGAQWDAIMRWLSKDNGLKVYLANSNGKGLYGVSSKIRTGSNEYFQTKNIYDLAGNEAEWTMESYLYNGGMTRVLRGGCGYHDGSVYCMSARIGGTQTTTDNGWIGFRPALFV